MPPLPFLPKERSTSRPSPFPSDRYSDRQLNAISQNQDITMDYIQGGTFPPTRLTSNANASGSHVSFGPSSKYSSDAQDSPGTLRGYPLANEHASYRISDAPDHPSQKRQGVASHETSANAVEGCSRRMRCHWGRAVLQSQQWQPFPRRKRRGKSGHLPESDRRTKFPRLMGRSRVDVTEQVHPFCLPSLNFSRSSMHSMMNSPSLDSAEEVIAPESQANMNPIAAVARSSRLSLNILMNPIDNLLKRRGSTKTKTDIDEKSYIPYRGQWSRRR